MRWAHVILDTWNSLQSELTQIKGKSSELVGRIVLGVIPSALPMVSTLTQAMNAKHASVDFTVLSHSSEEIIRALNDFSIDAGITYLDNEPVEGLQAKELYSEAYALFMPVGHELAARKSVTWSEAANQRLCLLTPNMQNRRIIDRAFAQAQVHPTARVETNSIMNLLASVRSMDLCAIMPGYFENALGPLDGVVSVPLTDPTITHKVGTW